MSGDAKYRKDVFRMAEFLENELKAVGCDVRPVPLGRHVMDGEDLELPPALLAQIGNDPSKKTILLYGHFDVQPVSRTRLCRPLQSDISPLTSGSERRWMGHGTFRASR